MTTGRINQNATDTVTTPSEGLPEDNSEAPSPFKPTRHPAVTNQLRFNNSTNSVVCVLRFRAEDHYPATVQRIEHAQAGQKHKSAHDSLHWSREGQDRTSTAALKKPNSYAISPVVTALCYLRTAVFSNAKLVPTQTSQRIANARTDHLKNSAYCRQPKQNVPHSAQDATRVACPPHIRLSETPEVC